MTDRRINSQIGDFPSRAGPSRSRSRQRSKNVSQWNRRRFSRLQKGQQFLDKAARSFYLCSLVTALIETAECPVSSKPFSTPACSRWAEARPRRPGEPVGLWNRGVSVAGTPERESLTAEPPRPKPKIGAATACKDWILARKWYGRGSLEAPRSGTGRVTTAVPNNSRLLSPDGRGDE